LKKPNVYLSAVFNVEQLEQTRNLARLSPAPEYKPKEPDLELAEKILKNSPVQLEHTLEPGNRPRYDSFKDVISMPPQDSFASKEGYYAEVLHQLTHATGFSKRDNREGVIAAPKAKKNIDEELAGEMASLFLRLKTGLKLEPSHQKEHEDVAQFIESNCIKENGEVFNSFTFAIAATNAQRMAKDVIALSREKTQEKSAEQAPEQNKTSEQDKSLNSLPWEEAQENTSPREANSSARKAKRGKAQEIDCGR
jgi:antirestriction protein ArdC